MLSYRKFSFLNRSLLPSLQIKNYLTMYNYTKLNLFGSEEFRNDSTCTKALVSFLEASIETIVERGKILYLVNEKWSIMQYEAGQGPFTGNFHCVF